MHAGVDALESKEILSAMVGPSLCLESGCVCAIVLASHESHPTRVFDDTTDSSAAVRDGEEECEDPRPFKPPDPLRQVAAVTNIQEK